MNKISSAQQLLIDELNLRVTEACKSLRSIMERFINFINSNKEATFKVFIDSDNHKVNGPNAFPIIFKSKKGLKLLWESDCCKCRIESDLQSQDTSSSLNLLFMNFQQKPSSPIIEVVSKKSKKKKNKTINDKDENDEDQKSQIKTINPSFGEDIENINPNIGNNIDKENDKDENEQLQNEEDQKSQIGEDIENINPDIIGNNIDKESDSDNSLSDIFKDAMRDDSSAEEQKMDVVQGEEVEVEMDILPASESWHLTVDDVIEKIKSKNNNITKSENFVFLHMDYLSQRFGNQTFEEITKKFIKDYSQTSLDQLVLNRKYEKKKSKLLYDFLSCQLLVYRPKDNNYDYITKLIAEIRK